MQPLISVIIPVYNTENLVKKCIESVQNQSYKNIEIILVDDGSTDSSGDICNFIAQQDERINLFHQTNKGQAAARNKGLQEASGQYIGFVDSDDWIDSKMYETLLNNLLEQKCKISCCGTAYTKKGEIVGYLNANISEFCIIDRTDALLDNLENKRITSSVCDKLFDVSLFKKTEFVEGIKYEDFEIVPRLLTQCERVVYCGKPMYFYEQTDDSTMRNGSVQKYYDLFYISHDKYQLYLDNGIQSRNAFENHLKTCIYALSNTANEDTKHNIRSEIVKEIRKLQNNSYYPGVSKILKIKTQLSAGNLKVFDFLTQIYHKILHSK